MPPDTRSSGFILKKIEWPRLCSSSSSLFSLPLSLLGGHGHASRARARACYLGVRAQAQRYRGFSPGPGPEVKGVYFKYLLPGGAGDFGPSYTGFVWGGSKNNIHFTTLDI